ncbi:MAG: O-antigen ligase family protein [Paludibacteraceae bacterium]|nr:O-antigen ligase family protein [Paludibacteraceae bacterium]
MPDLILSILSLTLFVPFLRETLRRRWTRSSWSGQLLLATVSLELTATMYIPSVTYIAGGLIAVAAAVYALRCRRLPQATPLLIIALLYTGWFALSLCWSAVPRKGLLVLVDNCLPLLVAGVAGGMCRQVLADNKSEGARQAAGNTVEAMLRTFALTACIFVALAVASWLVTCAEIRLRPWHWPVLDKTRVAGFFPYHWVYRFLGGHIGGYVHPSYNLLPIFAATAGAVWLRFRKASGGALWSVLYAGCLLLTLLTQSRMGIIYSAILAAYALILLQPSRSRRLVAAAVMLVTAVAVAVCLHGRIVQYGSDPTREFLISRTWQYIRLKPFTGAGAGALNPVEICHTTGELYWPHIGYIDPARAVDDWPYKAHMMPHNQWLADWAHAGLVAALLALMLYACVLTEAVRKRCWWGLCFMLVFTVFSLLEPPLYIGKGLYLFCTVCILVFAAPSTSKCQAMPKRNSCQGESTMPH